MKDFRIAIIGCGTIGGGTARVLLEMKDELSRRAGRTITLSRILTPSPKRASERHGIPLSLFCGGGGDLSIEELAAQTKAIVAAPDIDLVVEAVGGSSQHVLDLALGTLEAKKHLVTANKALLSKHGKAIFDAATRNGRAIGFETSVCTSIPIVKALKESFVGDEVLALSGIMNGTSNYILSRMRDEGLSFAEALALAQEAGYAEADPRLDIGGGDAGHKLTILMKLAFGIDADFDDLDVGGIEHITREDMEAADELDCTIKLICFARRAKGGIYATVRPMMVKNSNLLSKISGATNAVRLQNRYSDENILIGRGAGSLEGGSAVASDIVFIARYGEKMGPNFFSNDLQLRNLDTIPFPYDIIFDTEDLPGITGLVTTAIGNQRINIDTVGHNRHGKDMAAFSIATMPCTLSQIAQAIAEVREKRPEVLRTEPKVFPILF